MPTYIMPTTPSDQDLEALGARGSAKLQSCELMEIDAFLAAIER